MANAAGHTVGRTGGDEELLEHVLALADAIRHRLAACCDQEGMNASQFALLQSIPAAGEPGCSQTELAAALGLSESNVCALVERSRAAGLLFRFRSKTDRRKSVLVLSDRGLELVVAISRARTQGAKSILSALSAEEKRNLRQVLGRWRSSPSLLPAAANEPDDPPATGSPGVPESLQNELPASFVTTSRKAS